MISIIIDNKDVYLNKSISILQAAKMIDVEIPSFCFHEKLSIAGNCRICLVEIKGSLKPIASCAVQVTEGMEVITTSAFVKKARESVLEFLLVNHPLDCPICDQGGECDLQEITLFFGNDTGRFYDYNNSRAVQDINLGLLVTTSLTKCIHCTRCVRFLEEIAHYNKLGMFGRSKDMMIGTFLVEDEIFHNELSANIIDLCPVGALTSKPYTFKARIWEIQAIETIDIFDSLGTNIRIDTRDLNIMRILPRINQKLNQEWITDKVRYSFDGYFLQRITSPAAIIKTKYIYNILNTNIIQVKTNYIETTWEDIIHVFIEDCVLLRNIKDMQIIVGPETSLEMLLSLRQYHNTFNMSGFFLPQLNNFNIDLDTNYISNDIPSNFENIDLFLFVGVNLRIENPLLNIRLKKAISNGANAFAIGPSIENNFIKKLDNSLKTFYKILSGKHSFCSSLIEAKNPAIIINSNLAYLFNNINLEKILKSQIIYLNTFNSYLALCELGFNNNNINSKLYYNLGNDNIKFNKNNYVVYQGTHADINYKFSDLIFPSNIFIEEPQLFLNILGNLNMTLNANISLKKKDEVLFSWQYINFFYLYMPLHDSIKHLQYYDFSDLVNILTKLSPKLNINILNKEYSKLLSVDYNKNNRNLINYSFLNNVISNFYLTNSISRISPLMNKLSKNYNK